eukprot:m.102613 g.102613  ORF g.102613 m.102613 type:complete len:166 (+) comp12595_c3_seq2:284-781(+)
MSSTSFLQIPSDFGYVGFALLGFVGVMIHKIFGVVAVRKKYKVPYPILYAKIGDGEIKEEKQLMEYNCTQRAHQNTLEFAPLFLAMTLFAGLRYPKAAAVGFSLWVLQRFFYFEGYKSGDPKNRVNMYFLSSISTPILLILTAISSFEMILEFDTLSFISNLIQQ